MIGIPSIPTDNLYKFLAVSGLVVNLFCTALLYLSTERASDAAAAYEVNKAKGLLMIHEIEVDSAMLPQYVRDTSRAFRLAIRELATHSAEAKGLVVRVNREGPLQKTLYLGIGFGAGFAAFGFVLWWRRLQRFLDEQVVLDTLAIRSKSAPTDPAGLGDDDVVAEVGNEILGPT